MDVAQSQDCNFLLVMSCKCKNERDFLEANTQFVLEGVIN